ncbi:MAG: hypothetical protein ACJ0Q3_09050 [Candidatus Azotimanducaceae bacterium]
MADETDNQNKNDAEEEAKPTSEADLEEAREELMAEVDGASEEEVGAASSSQDSGGEPTDLDGASESEVEPAEASKEEVVEDPVEEMDASESEDTEQVPDSEETAAAVEGNEPQNETAEQILSVEESEEEAVSGETPKETTTDLVTEEDSSNSDAQAVIALKADSRLYIYGEPEDPMVGVTQNIDRARELMLETMSKSRATTADSVQKARNLNLISGLFLCSALLAAVGFFVFMSIQMSQKIVEIDSLLTAVAKRSIQMTKGIEKFSVIEEQLEKTLGNQRTINDYLAKDDPYRRELNERIEELRNQLKKDMSARVLRSEGNLNEVLSGVSTSSSNNEQAIKQIASMVKNQGNPSKSIQDLQRSLSEIKVKLNDLYLIEQARLSREIATQRTREVEFEANNGLE